MTSTPIPAWAAPFVAHLDRCEALGVATTIKALDCWTGDRQVGERAVHWLAGFARQTSVSKSCDAAVEVALMTRAVNHAAAHPQRRVRMSVLRKVWERGVLCSATRDRPRTISVADAGLVRVDAFLDTVVGKSISQYTSDTDLRKATLTVDGLGAGQRVPTVGAPLRRTRWWDGVVQNPIAKDVDSLPDPIPSGFAGIPILIDRPIGFVQTGTASDGTTWERTFTAHNGYFPATAGGDGEELDLYLGQVADASTVYFIAQIFEDGSFDEWKAMCGFASREEAYATFVAHVPERFFGGLYEVPTGLLQGLLGITPAAIAKALAGAFYAVAGERVVAVSNRSVTKALEVMDRAAIDSMAAAVAIGSKTLGSGPKVAPLADGSADWRLAISKAAEKCVPLLISPPNPLTIPAVALAKALPELEVPYLVEYPDTPSARIAFGAGGQAFIHRAIQGRLFVSSAPVEMDEVLKIDEQGKAISPAAPPDAAPGVEQGNSEIKIQRLLKAVSLPEPSEDGQEEERFVLGVVLEPGVVDLQGDIYSVLEVRRTAHNWMARYQNIGVQHATPPKEITNFRQKGIGLADDRVVVVQSYLVIGPQTINGQEVADGAWILGVIVIDDELWAEVKAGEITGFSIGGFARKVPLTPNAA